MRASSLLAILLLVQLTAGQALAHAQLRGSDPSHDAVVAAPPEQVELTFSEPVSPLVMRFVADGAEPVEVAAESADMRVLVDVPEGLGQGTHLLSWRVVSVDGHPIGGTLVFSVGDRTRSYQHRAGPEGAAGLAAAGRFALTLAVVAGVGAAVFAALVSRDASPPIRRFGRAACLLVFPAAALAVCAQGLDMLALPPGGAFSFAPWRAGALSPTCLSGLAAVLAAATALAALTRGSAVPAVAAWGLAAVSFALSGHAAAADPRWLAAPSVALHALALIFWLGSLVPLLIVIRADGDAAPVVHRFSTIATPLVALLLATGAALTLIQAGSVEALLQSAYGRILLVKLVAVAGLLALAARNRLVHTPALAAGFAHAGRRLDRAIRCEVVLGMVVIALAASFRMAPPPRSLVAPPPPFAAMVHGSNAMAELALAPGRVGRNAATLLITDMAGTPLAPLEVSLRASLPERDIEAIRVEAAPEGNGIWRADPVNLPLAGAWELEIDILITDFTQETLSLVVPLTAD